MSVVYVTKGNITTGVLDSDLEYMLKRGYKVITVSEHIRILKNRHETMSDVTDSESNDAIVDVSNDMGIATKTRRGRKKQNT